MSPGQPAAPPAPAGPSALLAQAARPWLAAPPDPSATPTEIRQAERRADVRTAVVTYLACLLLLAVDLTGIAADAPLSDLSRWWHLLPLTTGCALMLIKRRHPLVAVSGGAVLVALDLLLGGSIGSIIVFIDLLYAAGLYATPRARRALIVVAGAGVVASMVAAGATGSRDLQAVISGALQGVAILVVPLWWAADVRQKADLAALAFERETLARARAADLVRIADLRRHEAVLAERRAMARDLHDVVAGHVSAVAIRTGAALTPPDVPPRERETLEFVRATSLTALQEMRTMILLLRGDALDDSGTDEQLASPGRLADLATLVDARRAGGLDVVVKTAHTATQSTRTPPETDPAGAVAPSPADQLGAARLPAAVDQAAFRITQEALTNAAKHGGPGEVVVTIEATASALALTVSNPLPTGHPPRQPPAELAADDPASTGPLLSAGIGLVTMRERAEGLGGTFRAGATGPLWTVHASVPLSEPS